jgi:effector-binding domain-containing protein
MPYDVRLENLTAPQPLLVVRRRATAQDLPKVIPAACGSVWNFVRAHHIIGAGRHVALYLDAQINLEVGVEVDTPVAGEGEVLASQLPTGAVATAVHFGPYNRLADAHNAIRYWCLNQAHTLAGPNWEIYGHWQDAWNTDPSKIRTDVFYLLSSSTHSEAG